MLESLINFEEMKKKPYLVFIWTIILSSVAVLFSAQLSYVIQISGVIIDLSGLFAVLFTIIPSIFFFTVLLKSREKEEEQMIKKFHKKRNWLVPSPNPEQKNIKGSIFHFPAALSYD